MPLRFEKVTLIATWRFQLPPQIGGFQSGRQMTSVLVHAIWHPLSNARPETTLRVCGREFAT